MNTLIIFVILLLSNIFIFDKKRKYSLILSAVSIILGLYVLTNIYLKLNKDLGIISLNLFGFSLITNFIYSKMIK
jgi:hypothetical protein